MTKLKKKNVALIVGGTGQFGISLSKYLLRKNFKIIITTRNKKKHKFDFKKKILIKKLSIFQKKEIELLVNNAISTNLYIHFEHVISMSNFGLGYWFGKKLVWKMAR